jgi:trehalose synthase
MTIATASFEVPVLALTPERFRAVLADRYAEVEDAIERAGRLLDGRVIWHVNSTARGGGVVELLQSLLAYARGGGVDARWLVVAGNPDFFTVTKRVHNRLHGSLGDGGDLDADARRTYEATLEAAGSEIASVVGPRDVVVLHDPQTAGLVGPLTGAAAAVIWRCHVGVDHPNDLAHSAWDLLRPYVEPAAAYIFSRREFVWEGLDAARVAVLPPTIDAFSAKNQELEPEVVDAILGIAGVLDHAGGDPRFARSDDTPAHVRRAVEIDEERRLDGTRPLVCQVSRWDRLKDPVGVIEGLAPSLPDLDADLVLAGPAVAAVADDPEGLEVLGEVRAARAALPEPSRTRVHLACLPMDDVEENAAIVNALQRRSDVIVQKSLAEGFGLTVAEAMWKRKPVVGSRVGGIQDQIVDGTSGVLLDDPADLASLRAAVVGLVEDPTRAREIGEAARERIRDRFLGTAGLLRYLELLERLLA